jgi:hypothetical protein
MSTNEFDDLTEAGKIIKRVILWIIFIGALVSVGAFFLSRSVAVVDNGIEHYEEFQEIYNTCQKIDSDLATIRAVPDADKMFGNLSKAAQVTAKKQQMTRWVEEYNAKSKMINRDLWKSRTLPNQLSVEDFSHYKD